MAKIALPSRVPIESATAWRQVRCFYTLSCCCCWLLSLLLLLVVVVAAVVVLVAAIDIFNYVLHPKVI